MNENLLIQKSKSKNLVILFLSNLLTGFGFSTFNVVFQPFVYEIYNSAIFISYFVSFGFVIQFIPMPWAGKLSDRVGRKIFILLGGLGIVFGLIILSVAHTLVLLLFGTFCFYFGLGMRDPSFQTFVKENSMENKSGFMYAIMFFGNFGGSIGGTWLVSFLGEEYKASFYFILFGILYAIQWILQLIFIRLPHLRKKIQVNKDSTISQQKRQSLWKTVFKDKHVRNVAIFFFMDGLNWGMSVGLFNGGVVATYGITKERLAILILVFNMSNMLFQIPAGKIVDKLGKRNSIILSECFGMLFMSINVLAWFNRESIFFGLLIIAEIVLSVAVALFIPAQLVVFTSLDVNHPAETYGIVSLVLGIAFAPSTLIGGILIEKVHYILPFCITFCLIPLEILFLIKKFDNRTF